MSEAEWAIGPSIGIARVGNSESAFYVEPERAGVLPICSDCRTGNIDRDDDGGYRRIDKFKDADGRIKRQAARFRLFRRTESGWRCPVAGEVADVSWTVHLANKKACWYEFAELRGNLLYSNNAYDKHDDEVRRRNPTIVGNARQKLIIDFGPRTVSRSGDRRHFDESSRDGPYPRQMPNKPRYGDHVQTLGEILLNDQGELLVLGGLGRAGGDVSISSFAGADSWVDDISDGPVICNFRVEGRPIEARAWCIVGPPRFAPEILNIVSLADTMEDVAVRHFDFRPDVFAGGSFVNEYQAEFERDIRPILERPATYRWVANVPAVLSASPPPFDPKDNSENAAPLREAYLSLFRRPSADDEIDETHSRVLVESSPSVEGFPMLPINAGSNPVSNDAPIDKFMSLTQTQHFMLNQWAAGRFRVEGPTPFQEDPDSLTRASLGNCVGAPFCPGIEVTWTTRNPHLYERPFAIHHRRTPAWYQKHGLDPDHDETDPHAGPRGCEPGDLTKRMAIPWQADFFQCAAQYINYSDPTLNQKDGIPAPPAYYAYWWPPQSPWHVMSGDMEDQEQALAGTPAGYQVVFTRGINTFSQMIEGWSYVGFIVNRTKGALRDMFPNFTETERNHDRFFAASMSVGLAGDVASGSNSNANYTWLMRPAAAESAESVKFSTSRRRGRVTDRSR